MKKLVFFALCFFFYSSAFAQLEVEPNDNFGQANFFAQGTVISGATQSANLLDYFGGSLTNSGTVRVIFNVTNTSGSASTNANMLVYRSDRFGIRTSNNFNIPVGGTIEDTIDISCRQQDTLYFQVQTNGSVSYDLTYSLTSVGTQEPEPNDGISLAVPLPYNTVMQGQVGHSGIGLDANDYWEAHLPDDGTVRVILDYNNTSNSNISSINLYAKTRNGVSQASSFNSNTPLGQTGTPDTLLLHCRAADTLFFQVQSSGCFSYDISFDVLSTGVQDAEPNNGRGQAILINPNTVLSGRVGYVGKSRDGLDYYKAYLPDDGTVRVILDYNNTSNSNTAGLSLVAQNKSAVTIGSISNSNVAIGKASAPDTLLIYCRAKDTIYFRVTTGNCFTYDLSYSMLTTGVQDPEPNATRADAILLPAQTTASGRLGHISNVSDGVDYYKAYLPDDGTIRVIMDYNNTSNSNSSVINLTTENKNGISIGSIWNSNVPLGKTPIPDTLLVYCRAQDTVFFKLTASGCFSYDLTYDMLTTGSSDLEPNDTRADAMEIYADSTVDARIGYTGIPRDKDDYFFTELPSHGTVRVILDYNNTSNSNSNLINFYCRSKTGITLASSQNSNVPLGPTLIPDTMYVPCQAQDTVFFYVQSSGCFSYKLRYEMIDIPNGDTEPNNTFNDAILLSVGQTIEGSTTYLRGRTNDDPFDYYKIVGTGLSSVTAFIEVYNTSNSTTNDFLFKVYNKSQIQIGSADISNLELGLTLDTAILNCLAGDTLFFRISSSSCSHYRLRFRVVDEEPEAEIKSARYGNTFAFTSKARKRDSVFWDFDDGTSSSLRHPKKEFAVGVYTVRMEGINPFCNLSAKDSLTVSIPGIEYYLPDSFGIYEGLGFGMLRFFGGSLDSLAEVELIKGSTILRPTEIGAPSLAEFNALFNLKDAELGLYDVKIKLSNGDSFLFPNGMTLFEGKEGHGIVTSLNGTALLRTGRWTNYSLNVKNTNFRVTNGAVVGMVLPKGSETNIKDVLRRRSDTLSIKSKMWDELSIPRADFEEVYFQNTFDPDIDTITVDYSEEYKEFDQWVSFDIDTLYDRPFEGTVYLLYFPIVPGKTAIDFQFKIRVDNAGDYDMLSYAWPYPYRNNPPSAATLEWIHTAGMQGAALAEYAPNPALKAVGKSAGYIDIGSKIVFTEAFDWWYGTNNANASFYGEQGLAFAGEHTGALNPYGKKYSKVTERANATKIALKRNTEHTAILNETILNGGLSPSMANSLRRELVVNTNRIKRQGQFLNLAEKMGLMYKAKEYVFGRGLSFAQGQLSNWLFGEKTELNLSRPKRINRKYTQVRNSRDPNEIYGETGYTDDQYINKRDPLNYWISFENVDTAQLPAQIVKIDCILDPTKFDLSQTTVSDITIGENTYFFEDNRSEFFTDIDLRPAKNIVVRVTAKLDNITGELHWEFISLDPNTGALISDVADGFLPPNLNSPEGEGSVSFSTQLLPSVSHDEQLDLFATIFFDENEPIITNHWLNKIDDRNPVANLNSTINLENDTTMVLNFSGADMGSQIENYNLRVQIDGVWAEGSLPIYEMSEIKIDGLLDYSYGFALFAVDSTGNEEQKPLVVEASINLGTTGPYEVVAFPNPTVNELTLRGTKRLSNSTVSIHDYSGKLIDQMTAQNWRTLQIDMEPYREGAYVLRISDADLEEEILVKVIVLPKED